MEYRFFLAAAFFGCLILKSQSTLRPPEVAIVPHHPRLREYRDDFNSWKSEFQRRYINRFNEKLALEVWVDHRNSVVEHNLRFLNKEVTYRKYLNRFSDQPLENLIRMLKPSVDFKEIQRGMVPVTLQNIEVPESINVDLQDMLSTFRTDLFGSDGWIISATKAVEAQFFKYTGGYKHLDMGELESCMNHDERPGLPTDAFEYLRKFGLFFENEKPNGVELLMRCCIRKIRNRSIRITDYRLLEPENEENLKTAVALIGPISVSITVTGNFFFYKSGVFYDPMCSESASGANHAVLLVGYGNDDNGGDFWIIHNSWGTHWGDDGYGKMARNRNNHCGIASAAIYPVL